MDVSLILFFPPAREACRAGSPELILKLYHKKKKTGRVFCKKNAHFSAVYKSLLLKQFPGPGNREIVGSCPVRIFAAIFSITGNIPKPTKGSGRAIFELRAYS